MITTFINGKRQIKFDDFRRTKSFERLLSGLKALEADMRCWTPDELVDDAHFVYARALVEEALRGTYVGWSSFSIDERVRRMKWTNQEVTDFVGDLADSSYPELVALNEDTGRAIVSSLGCILDAMAGGRKRK